MRLLFLFVLTLGTMIPVMGQVYDVRTFSVNEGLPTGQVSDIEQDERGIIWIATYSGLVEFNGIEFKEYNTEHGLKDNFIYELFIDSESNFWITTEGKGVGLFDGEVITYPESVNKVLGDFHIMNIQESPDGRIWFATYENGVFVKDGDDFVQYTVDDGLAHNRVWHTYFDQDGKAWISTDEGLSVMDGDSITNYTESDGLSSNLVYKVIPDDNGVLWIATYYGVTKFEDGGFSVPNYLHGDKTGTVYDIATDAANRLWVGTALHGIVLVEGDDITNISKKNGLTSDYIYRLFKDRDQDIWIGTDEDGINIIKHLSFRFYGLDSGFHIKAVLSLYEDKDRTLWLGTDSGLTMHRNGFFGYDGRPKTFLRGKQIWNIEELPNGHLLVQADNSELYEFDGEKTLDYLKKIGVEGTEEYINELFLDSKNRLWIGTQAGVWKYEDGVLDTLSTEDGLSNDFVWVIREDSKGRIWIGTDNGINYYENGEIVNITGLLKFDNDSISDIVEDKDGNIWVGTGKGLCLLKEESGTWSHEKFELDEHYRRDTQFLKIDNEGFLWHGTNGGLHCYNLELYRRTGQMRTSYFPLEEHGHGVEFNHKAVISTQKGKILFGTAKYGVLEYTHMTKGGMKEAQQPIIVEATANFEPFEFMGDITPRLPYSDNNIEIGFSGLSYSDPNRTFYRYRLNGFDADWKLSYDEDRVQYTSLPPGSYTFEVYARTGQSDWSAVPASMSFRIQRPFWLSIWFYVGLFLAIAFIVASYIRYQFTRVEKTKLKKLVDEQTLELSDALEEKEILIKEIHHRVKNNLAVISGLLELQIWAMKDESAKRSLLESQLRIKTMATIHEKLYQNKSLARVDIRNYIEDLVNIVSLSLKRSDLEVELVLDVQDVELSVNQAVPTALILNELICNAYEHAFADKDKGEIHISFYQEGDMLFLIMKDNGMGIPDELLEKKRGTLGLTLIHTLTQQLKGIIEFENEGGTRVNISYPTELQEVSFLNGEEAEAK